MVDDVRGEEESVVATLQHEVTQKLGDIYRQRMAVVDFDIPGYDFHTQRFSVRHWDGMDGCWSDIATNVSGYEALTVWFERTDNGTRRLRFAEIDYVRLFPGGTKMIWDGSPGAEMFRGGGEEDEDDDE